MKDLRAFAQVGAVGDVQIRQRGGVHGGVFAVAPPLHQIAREIHVNQAFVHENHAVLQTRVHAQFPGFGFERQVGLDRLRNLDFVKAHQSAQRRGDDRRRAAQPQPQRDVRFVFDGEIAVVQGDAPGGAVSGKTHQQRADEADASVVPAPERRLAEVGEVLPDGDIHRRGLDFEPRAGIEQDAGAEVLEREGDRLAEIAVGRVAQQSGAGVGGSLDHAPKGTADHSGTAAWPLGLPAADSASSAGISTQQTP